jgi:hypothetical protein
MVEDPVSLLSLLDSSVPAPVGSFALQLMFFDFMNAQSEGNTKVRL